MFWLAILIGILPFLIKYSLGMWSQELYQYFPFLLASVFGIAFSRSDRSIYLPRCRWSVLSLVMALLVIIPATILQSSWLGAVAFVFLSASFLTSMRSIDGSSLGYLTLPMIMFLRAPLLGTYTIMVRLQKITTMLSSILLDVAGVVHVQSGNTLELASKRLFVAEACSGVQSLYTMCFLALLILVYRKRSFLLVPIYLSLAIAFAVVGNTIRVTVIAVAQEWMSIDLSYGLAHDLLGYLSLAIAAAALVAIDHLIGLGHLFWQVPSAEQDAQVPTNANSSTPLKCGPSLRLDSFLLMNWLQKTAILLIGVSGATMAVAYVSGKPEVGRVVSTDKVLFEPPTDLLNHLDTPVNVMSHNINRDAHGNRNARHGMNSDVWMCGMDSHQGQFVLSQPYMGWHELTLCYQVLDWNLINRETVQVPGYHEPIVSAEFESRDGIYGCLVFCAVNSDGRIPRTPGHSPYSRILAPFHPLILDDFAETTGSAQTMMLQYWMTNEQPIRADARQSAVKLIAEIREEIADRMSQSIVASP